MAGKTIDMSRIKQLLQLKKLGLSNRQIAEGFPGCDSERLSRDHGAVVYSPPDTQLDKVCDSSGPNVPLISL